MKRKNQKAMWAKIAKAAVPDSAKIELGVAPAKVEFTYRNIPDRFGLVTDPNTGKKVRVYPRKH